MNHRCKPITPVKGPAKMMGPNALAPQGVGRDGARPIGCGNSAHTAIEAQRNHADRLRRELPATHLSVTVARVLVSRLNADRRDDWTYTVDEVPYGFGQTMAKVEVADEDGVFVGYL